MAYGNYGGGGNRGYQGGGNRGGGYQSRGNGGGYGGQRRGNGGGYQNRNGNGRCTPKQAEILQRYGHNPNVSFQEASRIINGIAQAGWPEPQGGGQQRQSYGNNGGGNRGGGNRNGRCTPKQAEVLERYGHNPNVSFAEASQIIDDIAAAGWPEPDGGNQDGGNNFGGYQAEVQYGDDGSAPWDGGQDGGTY